MDEKQHDILSEWLLEKQQSDPRFQCQVANLNRLDEKNWKKHDGEEGAMNLMNSPTVHTELRSQDQHYQHLYDILAQ